MRAALLLTALLAASCGARSELRCSGNDADGDCVPPLSAGGSDCDDSRSDVYPGAPDNAPGELRTTVVAPASEVPFPWSIDMSPGGTLHAVSAEGSGVHLSDASGDWQLSALPAGAPDGYGVRLLARADGLRMVLRDGISFGRTLFAFHPGESAPDAAWQVDEVSDSTRGFAADLWHAPDGSDWVAYLRDSTDVRIARRSAPGAAWSDDVVQSIQGWGWLRLSGSSDGTPWLLVNRLRDIYAEGWFHLPDGEGGWQSHQLTENATSNMELALAEQADGAPHLALQYSRHGAYGPGGEQSRIEYHAKLSSAWVRETVDDEIWVDCMTIGSASDGVLRIAAVGQTRTGDEYPRELRAYRRSEGDWVRTHRYEIPGRNGGLCAIFLDSASAVTLLHADDRPLPARRSVLPEHLLERLRIQHALRPGLELRRVCLPQARKRVVCQCAETPR